MLRGFDEGYSIPSLGIATHPDHRRATHAGDMIDHLHAVARVSGATKVRLKVYPDNHAAMALYLSAGYVLSDEIESRAAGCILRYLTKQFAATVNSGMKIGLYYDRVSSWQGGRDLFAMLFQSLQVGCEPDDQIGIVVHKSRDKLPWRLARIGKHLLTRFPPDYRWIASEIRRIPRKRVIEEAIEKSIKLAQLGKDQSTFGLSRRLPSFDIIGPCTSPPEKGEAWFGYIPDCQHRRLPHFFSQEECAARDKHFAELLNVAPVVIVNSSDAKADLLRYFGPVRAEIVALPFAASPHANWFDTNPTRVQQKYRLPGRYFLCSNQFWQHKNHGVILDALGLAKSEGKSLCVVFTGEMADYREPSYVQKLAARVHALGIGDACHFLGLIPKLDQIAIMRDAIAVVQPTLFEGGPGGGAVYDAVSLGQRVIVSEIPVNREIEQFVEEYFPPGDARALYASMCRASDKARPKRDRETLLRAGGERRRRCGTILRSAFALAIERSSQSRHAARGYG